MQVGWLVYKAIWKKWNKYSHLMQQSNAWYYKLHPSELRMYISQNSWTTQKLYS